MFDLIANGKGWGVELVEQSAGSRQCSATSPPEFSTLSANQPDPPALPSIPKAATPEQILNGLPLNRDDWKYIDRLLLGRGSQVKLTVLEQYRSEWEAASHAEPLPHRKDNAGRFAANVWLRISIGC